MMRKNLTLACLLLAALAASPALSTGAVPSDTQSEEYPPYDIFFPPFGDDVDSVVVRAQDDAYGTNVALRACFATADASSCDQLDPFSEYRCGGQAFLQGDGSEEGILVQLLPLLIEDDLTFCGATLGVMTTDWFSARS